jgi:hypothetical protein
VITYTPTTSTPTLVLGVPRRRFIRR